MIRLLPVLLRRVLLLLLVVGAVGAITSGQTAFAQVLFDLTPAGMAGNPGDTLTFSGTIRNQGASEIFLNGLEFNLTPESSSVLTTDDTPFFTNVPVSLAPNAFYTGSLFSVTISSGLTQPGTYGGQVTLLGGTDGTMLNPLATQGFQVYVPEPGSGWLLGSCTPPLLMGLVLRRRQTKSRKCRTGGK